MRTLRMAMVLMLTFGLLSGAAGAAAPISAESMECMDCHAAIHPGIVEAWQKSRHAAITPEKAMQATGLTRRVSAGSIPEYLQPYAVGCAECHTLRTAEHRGSFEHNGHQIHTVVSPNDCKTCHTTEAQQYSRNLMSHAYGNLANNAVFQALEHSIIGRPQLNEGKLTFGAADEATRAEACYYCHGTRLNVTGSTLREHELFGDMEFPVIDGWPNQGVGRINLDDSRGSCAACHTRHTFSVAMARKPYTCKECHVGPDVPAYKVYESSKHGNIFKTEQSQWDFKAVPWTVGRDFTAPTCATCHISGLVNTDQELISSRTHQMSDRLPWRIFGLIYAHPHPLEPDTTLIRSGDGLPLPTQMDGTFASEFLIDETEMDIRRQNMQAACLSCHASSWVDGHWQRFENTIQETNASTLTATQIMAQTWHAGFASGLSAGASPFDEAIEKRWMDIWLFYANTIRFASAMGGGGDYGVFADGRYQKTQAIKELYAWPGRKESVAGSKEQP